jgi:hypothetical protein
MAGFDMKDYVPVSERVDGFYKVYPEGSIQSEIVELTDSRVTVKAYAYRNPNDPRPGIGHSSLGIPGSTSFTKGSEIENAETSAWGRAIAALGFDVKRGIASYEEVRNKPSHPSRPAPPASTARSRLVDVMKANGISLLAVEKMTRDLGVPEGERATDEQIEQIITLIETPGSSVPTDSPATEAPASEGTQTSEIPTDGGLDADVVAPEGVPPSSSGAPTLEDVLAVSGGELVPPKPGSDEYRSLSAMEKSQARAYWARAQPQGARETHEPTQVGAAL